MAQINRAEWGILGALGVGVTGVKLGLDGTLLPGMALLMFGMAFLMHFSDRMELESLGKELNTIIEGA